MKKALLLSLLFVVILAIGCTSGPARKSCKTSEDCESWRECNVTKGYCVAKPGFCETDDACGAYKVCNKQHLCELKAGFCNTTEDCLDWQTCDSVLGRCETKIGYCFDDTFCLNDWEGCNNATHTCATKKGRCVDNLDCQLHQLCNIETKKCYPMQGRCDDNSSCERWQYCDQGAKKCALKPGLCGSDGDCKSYEICDEKENRCFTRKLADEEKIITLFNLNGTEVYTLKYLKTRNTEDSLDKILGDMAEIPLEKNKKTLLVLDANVTYLESTATGLSQVYLFALVKPNLMQEIAKGQEISIGFQDILETNEPKGFARIVECTENKLENCFGKELALTTANWYVRDLNWKPGTRLNLSKIGIKSGDKFRLIVEFDHKQEGGTINIYIVNKYGQMIKVSSANYTTYKNGDGKDSVAALTGGVVHSVVGGTHDMVVTIGKVGVWGFENYTYVLGQCSDDNQCNPWELCNPITHSCYMKLGWCLSDGDCPKGYNCKLDPRTIDRRICVPIACGGNLDCPGSTCDIEMHLCRPVPPYCSPDNYTCYETPRKCSGTSKCAPWESCEAATGACLTKIGMCGSDHDCPIGTLCELDPNKQNTHTCVAMVCKSDSDCLGTSCDTYRGQCRGA